MSVHCASGISSTLHADKELWMCGCLNKAWELLLSQTVCGYWYNMAWSAMLGTHLLGSSESFLTAAWPRSSDLEVTTTAIPASASSRAISYPMPLLAASGQRQSTNTQGWQEVHHRFSYFQRSELQRKGTSRPKCTRHITHAVSHCSCRCPALPGGHTHNPLPPVTTATVFAFHHLLSGIALDLDLLQHGSKHAGSDKWCGWDQ